MGLLDILTGGQNSRAQAQLQAALDEIKRINVPTANDLTLSPLQQFVNSGDLQAAMAQAAQAEPSAFNKISLSSLPMETMQQVLAKQGEIANADGMTPEEQAKIAQALEAVNTNTRGQRGAIEQSFAARGIPQSLISAALQNQTAGQEAQQGYSNALQARAAASSNAQNALNNQGQLAGQMQNMNANQANTVAAAQDALNKFNAANTQQANLANQGTQQQANTYNTTNKQNVSNMNTEGAQKVQYQNQVGSKETAAQLALQKANAMAGLSRDQANASTAAGQQQAGLYSGLLGSAAQLGAAYAMGPAGVPIASNAVRTGMAKGGYVSDDFPATNFKSGGQVPGEAVMPGDSPVNDTVPAKLSPGEFVVPRTAMADPGIRRFLAENVPTPRPPEPHPSDVASILKALSMLRGA